jgi:hypothetical protein
MSLIHILHYWGSIVLATKVTPGLLAGAEPDAHQFLCHSLFNGVIRWVKTQDNIALTWKNGLGM